MGKIINIKSGREVDYPKKAYSGCSICDAPFCYEDEGGMVGGVIGIIAVNFCPTCFNGILEMAEYFRGEDE